MTKKVMYQSIITLLIVRRCIRIIGKLLSVLVLQVYYCIENFSVNIFIQLLTLSWIGLHSTPRMQPPPVLWFFHAVYIQKRSVFFFNTNVYMLSHPRFFFHRLSNTSKPIIMNPMIDLYYLCMDHMDVERIVLILTTLLKLKNVIL